ncbi:MAG: acyl carrier protein [Roseiarcus sp.]
MDDPRVAQILDIVAKETFVDRTKLVPAATIDDLGIASIDIVQTIFAIETEYNIELPLAQTGGGAEFPTVGALVDHVLATLDKAKLRGKAKPGGDRRQPEPANAVKHAREP